MLMRTFLLPRCRSTHRTWFVSLALALALLPISRATAQEETATEAAPAEEAPAEAMPAEEAPAEAAPATPAQEEAAATGYG
ncbi:MAG: hypothetical protein WBD14_02485, partial [Phycisphaerae bacterium]